MKHLTKLCLIVWIISFWVKPISGQEIINENTILTGVVLDSVQQAKPIVGATVRVNGLSTNTRQNGDFSFRYTQLFDARQNQIEVWVLADGYYPKKITAYTNPTGSEYRLIQPILLSPTLAPIFSGFVIDSQTEQGVEGVEISFPGSTQRIVTDAGGAFFIRLEDDALKSVRKANFQFSKEGYRDKYREFNMSNRENGTQFIELKKKSEVNPISVNVSKIKKDSLLITLDNLSTDRNVTIELWRKNKRIAYRDVAKKSSENTITEIWKPKGFLFPSKEYRIEVYGHDILNKEDTFKMGKPGLMFIGAGILAAGAGILVYMPNRPLPGAESLLPKEN